MYNNESFIDYVSEEYPNFDVYYTDGSKVRGNVLIVGCSIYFPAQGIGSTYRLHLEHSVIYSELFAIDKALETIQQCDSQDFIIFSDLESALQLIASNPKTYVVIVTTMKIKLNYVNQDRNVLLHWVKVHRGIKGNEIADKLAKMAVNNRSVYSPLTREELVMFTRETRKLLE